MNKISGPYELCDEVEVEGEVDHGEDEGALDARVLGRHQPWQKINISSVNHQMIMNFVSKQHWQK